MSAPGADGTPGSIGSVPEPPSADWSQAPRGSGPPEWLTPITDKLDELGHTTSLLADQYAQLQQPYEQEGYEEEYDPDAFYDQDGEEDYGEDYEDGEADGHELTGDQRALADDYIVDRIAGEVDTRRRSDEDARAAFLDREDMFDELRDSMPLLQDEQTAVEIVNQAREIAESWDPDLIHGPEFVQLIRLVALAAIADGATGQPEPQPPAAPPQPAGLYDRQVMLESANGAAPARSNNEIDWGARMLEAANRLRPGI